MKTNVEQRQWVAWLGVTCLGMLASPVTLAADEPKSPALQILREPMTHHPAVLAVAYHPNGKTLASGSHDGTIKLWDVTTGKEHATLKGHASLVHSVAFSPDGKTLASGSVDQAIKLWEVKTGKERATLKGHKDWVWSVAYSPDGKTLASASKDTTIKLWDVATSKEKATLKGEKGHWNGVTSVAFSPDGKTLASGSLDTTILLWDVSTGKERATLKGHTQMVWSVAFSPDGKTLASASGDKTLMLWDVPTGKELATLKGHTEYVHCVAYSPDGKTLASGGSLDKSIKLWDVQTGKGYATLKGHTSSVYSVAFSPDGTTLASGSDDQTIKLWDMPAAKQADKPLPADDEADLSGKKLNAVEGTWDLVAFGYDGSRARRVSGRRVGLIAHVGINGGSFAFLPNPDVGTWSYAIDPSTTPKRIDLTAHLTSPGIYEVKDDELRMCLGAIRPTAFTADKGSQQHLFIFKRVNK